MIYDRSEPAEENQFQAGHAALIATSYSRLTKGSLLSSQQDTSQIARDLYHAPFAVLAHDIAQDPVFFYANLVAQELFAMDWNSFVTLPSRLSAEPLAQNERQTLLDRVQRFGFIDDYSGVRIASDGRRFHIEAATVWNLYDEQEQMCGQAAAFNEWRRV